MPRYVVVRPGAEQDIREIVRWYTARQETLGEQFLSALEECMQKVNAYPELFPVVYRSVRRAIVPKFPYLVFYLSEPDRTVMLAVLHSSRNPAHWPRH